MGFELREDNVDEWCAELKRRIDVALEEMGLVAEGIARNITPVDTGRLKNSITHRVDSGGSKVAIGTNVEYGRYIELGHHSYPGANGGRGFLRPAVTDNADKYRKILESRLKS